MQSTMQRQREREDFKQHIDAPPAPKQASRLEWVSFSGHVCPSENSVTMQNQKIVCLQVTLQFRLQAAQPMSLSPQPTLVSPSPKPQAKAKAVSVYPHGCSN